MITQSKKIQKMEVSKYKKLLMEEIVFSELLINLDLLRRLSVKEIYFLSYFYISSFICKYIRIKENIILKN